MNDTSHRLIPGMYLLPSPAGAFKVISEPESNRLRDFLLALLDQQGKALANDCNRLAGFRQRTSLINFPPNPFRKLYRHFYRR